MNRKDVIEVLKMENDLITFDPHTGEEIDVRCLNDLNKKCYIAHEEAIGFLRQSIPVEWLYQKRTLYLENGCYMSLMVINELLNWWEKENDRNQT